MKRTLIKVLAVATLFGPVAWAQDQDQVPDGEPGRGVARLSLINGDVSVKRGDTGDWTAGAVNAPLMVDDNVMTGPDSRAEVEFDWANSLRLAPNSEVRLATLENGRYQVQLATGTVMLSQTRDSKADFEVDTPSVSVRPVERGRARVEVLPNGETLVTVRSGEVEVFTPTGVQRLNAGQALLARGDQNNPEYQMVSAAPQDDFDHWNADRDRRLERSKSYAYVNRDVYGADDLDSYGRWVYVPPYGWVWSPNGVGPDWAPYRDGRWVWADYYGWTWVGYEPWGWAPYHYGRWFYGAGYGWCWYPGGLYARHYWSPALVGFFGFGVGGVNIGIGFGNIGWVPLAPYEPYYPWYGRRYYHGYYGGGYWGGGIRIVNNINIYDTYRNARVHHGITGMDYDHFGRGGRGQAFDGRDARFRDVSAVHGALPVAPGRDSVRFSDRPVRQAPGRDFGSQRFYSRQQPQAVNRVPFETQRRGMEAMTRNTFGGRVPGRSGQEGGFGRSADVQRGSDAAIGGQGGWRRVGEPSGRAGQERMQAGQRGEAGGNGGWNRLGGRSADVQRADQGRVQAEQRGEAGGNGGWNRLGGRSADVQRADQGRVQAEQRGNSRNNGGWSQFGGRSADVQRADQGRAQAERSREQAAPQRESNQGNWRTFGGSGGTRGGQERQVETPRAQPRSDSRGYSQYDRSDSGRSYGGREPIRVNPPIVRERSGGDRGGGSSYNRAGGAYGGGYSNGGSVWSGGRGSYDRGGSVYSRENRGSFGGGSARVYGGDRGSFGGGGRVYSGGGGSRGSFGGGGASRSGGGGGHSGGGRRR